MRIFIEMPTWLGDCVMCSLAIRNLQLAYKDTEFIFFGKNLEILSDFDNAKFIKDDRKNRISNFIKLRSKLKNIDIAISFRSSIMSRILLSLIKAKKKLIYKKDEFNDVHQAMRYYFFISKNLGIPLNYDDTFIYVKPKPTQNAIGLNAGAMYGSAKMWDAKNFANLASYFYNNGLDDVKIFKDKFPNIKNSKNFIIKIFGTDQKICDEIASELDKLKIPYINLCNKTTIKQLCEEISSLSLFITNDSGPMHIAGFYKIPTISIFGATDDRFTNSFKNKFDKIVKLNLSCMPCMKRECPLNHHKCMKDLTPQIIIKELK